jgi:hypothetical protein
MLRITIKFVWRFHHIKLRFNRAVEFLNFGQVDVSCSQLFALRMSTLTSR